MQALRGVDFAAAEREFIVILGPSGSGKSTFLNIIGGLDCASSGKAWFHDHDLIRASEADLTRYRRATSAVALRLVGAVALPLAAILLLPLPFLHMLPGAAMTALAAGLAERDGYAIIAGCGLAFITLVACVFLVGALHAGTISFFEQAGT